MQTENKTQIDKIGQPSEAPKSIAPIQPPPTTPSPQQSIIVPAQINTTSMTVVPTESEKGFFDAYVEHSKTLRTWLVAYGIGGPVLFFTNDSVWNKLRTGGAGTLLFLSFCFFGGVVLQVLDSFLSKITMWGLYYGEANNSFKLTRTYKCLERFSEMFWIDIVLDVLSIILFSLATVTVLLVFIFNDVTAK